MPLVYVRVKVKDSSEPPHTVLQQEVDNNPDVYTVLKQDAVNLNGDPLPPGTVEDLKAAEPKPDSKSSK